MFSHCKLGLKEHDPVRVAAVPALHAALPSDPLLCEVPRDWQLGRAWDDDDLAWSPGLARVKSWGRPIDVTTGFLAKKCNEMYLPACVRLRVPSGVDYLRLLNLAGGL